MNAKLQMYFLCQPQFAATGIHCLSFIICSKSSPYVLKVRFLDLGQGDQDAAGEDVQHSQLNFEPLE
jgi:hypothetical protein